MNCVSRTCAERANPVQLELKARVRFIHPKVTLQHWLKILSTQDPRLLFSYMSWLNGIVRHINKS